MRLATSSCRVAGGSKHHWCFAARSGANAIFHNRLQTRMAGVSQQINQSSRSVNRADLTTQIRSCSERVSFLHCRGEIKLSLQSGSANRALATVWFTSRRPDLPKVLRTPFFKHFEEQIELSLESRALFVDNFATLPEKTRIAEMCATPRPWAT
jgi:hypothetical protein